MDGSMRSSSSISVRQLAKSAAKGGVGQCIRTTLPYIRSDVPVLIVFKALGFVVSAEPASGAPPHTLKTAKFPARCADTWCAHAA
jgi:RNA polymerase Rpb2, domain 2